MDDGHEDYKSETHYANMHMDEEDVVNIAEREVESPVYETEQQHINSRGLHCNMDGSDDGESHYEKTNVDNCCKVRC